MPQLPQTVAGTCCRNKVAVATYFLIEVAAATSHNHAYRAVYSSVLEVHSYLTQLFFCTFMAKDSRENAHQQHRARSYANLDKDAKRKKGYDWQRTRDDITSIFRERFGTDPCSWQLVVAILLGLHSVVIAGTGAGKTMPFMMPLLLDKKKRVIIISPLKVLQEDLASNSSYLLNLYEITGCAIWENGDRDCSRKWIYLVLGPVKVHNYYLYIH